MHLHEETKQQSSQYLNGLEGLEGHCNEDKSGHITIDFFKGYDVGDEPEDDDEEMQDLNDDEDDDEPDEDILIE